MPDLSDDRPIPDGRPDDLALTSQLGAVARFNPRPGFGIRVLSQVRHPLPRWARRVRDWLRGLVSGVRGWVILGSASLVTAAAWTVAVVAGIRSSDALVQAWDAAMINPELANLTWEARRALAAVPGDVIGALEATGMPWEVLAAGYGVLVVVSGVALWRLTTRPDRVRIR